MARSRNFCYTNYGEDFPGLTKWMKYHCRQEEECPTTGRRHFQGYFQCKNAKKLSEVMNGNAHIEIAKGNAHQNIAYCSKPPGGVAGCVNETPEEGFSLRLAAGASAEKKPLLPFEEWGIRPKQGERNDLKKIAECKDIMEVVEQYPSQFIRYHGGIMKLLQMKGKPQQEAKDVRVLIGPPGSGKTRKAYDFDADLYSKPEGKWWDGYIGQKTVLIDDYSGDIPYTELLKILDRYPIQVQIKNGFAWLKATTIWITSNENMDAWYPGRDLRALKRRINYQHTEAVLHNLELVDS